MSSHLQRLVRCIVLGALLPLWLSCAAVVSFAEYGASSDSRLASLTVRGAVLAAPFSPDVLEYHATTDTTGALTPALVTLTATASARGTVRILDVPTPSGLPSAPLAVTAPGPYVVDIVVTAQDQRAHTRYLVVIATAPPHYLKAPNTRPLAAFGVVAISGDTLAVGAPGESSRSAGIDGDTRDSSLPNAGAVYVYRRTANAWLLEAYLKPSDPREGGLFGQALALVGDTLAVGAPGSTIRPDGRADVHGGLYIFVRSGATWSEEARLDPPDKQGSTGFGSTLAMTRNAVATGAPYEKLGAAYVATRVGRTWSLEAIHRTSKDQYFGASVALDDDTLVVGAPGAPGTLSMLGSVRVYTRTGSSWTEQAVLVRANAVPGQDFGASVALSGDTLAVGSPGDSSLATGIDGEDTPSSFSRAGAVYLYSRSGTMWTQAAYVKATNTRAGAGLGTTIALAEDVLAIGAPQESSNATGIGGDATDTSTPGAGAVYLITRAGGRWAQHAYVKPPRASAMSFGASLALDRTALFVGAPLEASAASGSDGDDRDTTASGAGAVYSFLF